LPIAAIIWREEVGENPGGLGVDRELARYSVGAFLQLTYVSQSRLQPLQIVTIPHRVRFVGKRNSANAMLRQQCVADVPGDGAASDRGADVFGKLAANWLFTRSEFCTVVGQSGVAKTGADNIGRKANSQREF
jgi:hypothetical protein